MKVAEIARISLIGAGNVATALGLHFRACGLQVVDILVRETKAEYIDFANALSARLCTTYTQMTANTDLILIAVSDKAIESVAQELAKTVHLAHILVVHTSGATPMQILAAHHRYFGCFYPLQTFSKSRQIAMETVPICVAANEEEARMRLWSLAKKISQQVAYIDDNQRAALHVAAVFVNNFSNHLFDLAAQLCRQTNVNFDMLRPLIAETVAKLAALSPHEAQTGPARRGDLSTIERHQKLIASQPNLLQLYTVLSQSILDEYHNNR